MHSQCSNHSAFGGTFGLSLWAAIQVTIVFLVRRCMGTRHLAPASAQPVARLTRPTACTPQALQRWFGSGTPHGIANVSSSSLVLARRPSKRHALMRQAWQRRYKKRLRRSEGSKDIWTRPQNSPAWAVAIAPPRKHMGPPMPPGPLLQAKGQPSIEVQLAGHRRRPAPRLPMLGELDGAPGRGTQGRIRRAASNPDREGHVSSRAGEVH